MKTIIVKNDRFDTIGMEVSVNDRVIFTWGVSPADKSNFQKEFTSDEWMGDIIRLIELQAALEENIKLKSRFKIIVEESQRTSPTIIGSEDSNRFYPGLSLPFLRERIKELRGAINGIIIDLT